MIEPKDIRQLLKNKINEQLQCRMCGSIAYNPVQCGYEECEKLFCQSCLDEYKSNSYTQCPGCKNQPIKTIKPNIFIQNEIDIQEVRCKNKECKEIIIFSQIQDHIKQCKFNIVKCQNKDCDFSGYVMNIEDHKNTCKKDQITCKKCEKEKGENHDCLSNLLQIVNNYNEEINDLGSQLINTQIILQNLCQRFNQLKFEDSKIGITENQKRKIPQCKKEHDLEWIGQHSEICAQCEDDDEIIRYYCRECEEFYCQNCKVPVFYGIQCPEKHIMIYDAEPRYSITCDFCKGTPRENGVGVFSDRECNFDICKTCFDKMSC